MALTTVEPKTSKVTGGVLLDLYGSNLVEPETDILFDNDTIVPTNNAGGSVQLNLNGSARLSLSETIGARASVDLNRILPECFDLELFFTRNVRSFPLINDAKGLGIQLTDHDNIANVIKVFIQYKESRGYLLVIEYWTGTVLNSRDEMPFDHRNVETLSVKACGKYIHGLVKANGKYINFGKTIPLTGTAYRVRVFSEGAPQGVAQESVIDINKLRIHSMVAFAGYPTEAVMLSPTRVTVRTLPGEISLGDIILSTGNATNYKITNFVRYVAGSSISVVRKLFDTVQAVVNEYVNPPREKLFKSSKGFKWDDGYLLSESNKNNELVVPSLWDPTTGNIPVNFFQSGAGPFDALKFMGIRKSVAEGEEKWFAQINHGSYFVNNVSYFLFSDQSVIDYLGEIKTEDGRSKQPLLYKPKIGVPIVASSLGELPDTKVVVEKRRFQKRGRFTGKVINGVELDVSNVANIDGSKEEFVVVYNSNNEVKDWAIPVVNVAPGRYEFELPKFPLSEFKVRFSRKDIFKKEKIIARKYGDDTYSLFQYGEGVEDIGDYAIDYKRKKVEVLLDRSYVDLGYVSYTYDYPAVIEFNNDYTADKGTYITNPSFSDLNTLDEIGVSNGRAAQKMRLTDFPIVDYTTQTHLDTANFKLFIYDEFDNSFDKEWRRVSSFEDYDSDDKVYMVNSASGFVIFGDGVNGKIPAKYLKVLAAYKPTLKIQYEPESSKNTWSGKTTDLNLTKQSINSGFLFLSRKNLIPSQIVLEFASPHINAFETVDINATVLTQEGDVVPSARLNFEILAGGGLLRDDFLLTNPNGEANTIYTPSTRLEDIGIRVDCFEPSNDSEVPGTARANAYGDKVGIPYMSLRSLEQVQGNLAEMYVFKILDDGDQFLPYNNQTRQGGRLVLLHDGTGPKRGSYLAGTVMGFDEQLPQPFSPDSPNYEPNLRGFYIVGKKTIQARAYIDLEEVRVYSDIVKMTVEYSPLQKGTWRLPVPPVDFEATQINTATYISID